jgi:hypothetical protein
MYDNYLEDLPLSCEEKTKIARLGASNPAALLAMMQAAPEAFDRYLGSDRAQALASALKHLISEAEQAVLDAPAQRFCATGAIIDHEAPGLQPPRYDVAERDRLFDQLQRLRQQDDSSPATKRRIAELEQRLNTILQGA